MHPKDTNANDYALTLARGMQILEVFSPKTPTLTTSEAAQKIGISRAAARRLLLTFVQMGYLHQTKSAFSLTEKISTIGQGLFAKQERWIRATSHVLDLSNRMNEPFSISVLDGMSIRFVARDHKRRIHSAPLMVGDKLPAHGSAAGKVLLSALSTKDLRDRIKEFGPLTPIASKTITEPDALEEILRQVRLRSWASAEDEMQEGAIAIAVPVFDQTGAVIAALAVGSYKLRRSMDELRDMFLPIIQAAAERISQEIGETV